MEKMIEKVKNLLDLANNNPNENEAIAAALKAQQLMAKYNIEFDQVEYAAPQSREIVGKPYYEDSKYGTKKWRFSLATIVAKNFRCKIYAICGQTIVFYGYKEDVAIAMHVFKYLYEVGNRLALKKYREAKKRGLPTKNVQNTYLAGFRAGICSELEKQCTALMIVTPKEVESGFAEITASMTMLNKTTKTLGRDNAFYREGFTDGKNALQQMEG